MYYTHDDKDIQRYLYEKAACFLEPTTTKLFISFILIWITYYPCYLYLVFCMMQYHYGKHRSYSQAQIIQVPVIEVEGIYIHF